MDKSNQQFDDLFKVPDEAIIKSQSVEIGQLKSYIQELEEDGILEVKKLRHQVVNLQRKLRKYE